MNARLHFYGAAGCVTGACALVETDQAKVLVDCGLFQGPKTLKALNYERFPFRPEEIDAVLLTHAHIDHCGLIPKLALRGFKGPIYATEGTIELCRVMLPDAGAIQEMEVDFLNRRSQRRELCVGQHVISSVVPGPIAVHQHRDHAERDGNRHGIDVAHPRLNRIISSTTAIASMMMVLTLSTRSSGFTAPPRQSPTSAARRSSGTPSTRRESPGGRESRRRPGHTSRAAR